MGNEMRKYKIGYTQGVFDMFHIGHLNLLRNAKAQCNKLIVGVNSNELVESYKNKLPVIDEKARAEIILALKCVDECIIVNTLDKMQIWNLLNFEAIFIGSDWKENERWNNTKIELKKVGAEVVFIDYTPNVSSTILRNKENVED